jgi:lambda family phage portal protein
VDQSSKTPPPPEEDPANPRARGGKYMDADPGTIEDLPPGKTFRPWDPQHPTSQFGEFLKSILRGIASALPCGYSTLANDLAEANYSALRDGKLVERETYKVIQAWYIEQVKLRQFEEWLSYCLLAGKIRDPFSGAKFSPLKMDKLNQPVFRGRRWAWVDPLKQQQAAESMRRNGWTSDEKIVSDLGDDIEDVYDQIAKDDEEAKKRKLEFYHGTLKDVKPPAPPDDADAPGAKGPGD